MSSLIDALRNGVPSVWVPLAALLALLVYSLWHNWRYRLSIAEEIETTTDQPEFLQPSGERRERILKAGNEFGSDNIKSESRTYKWIILALAIILIAAAGWGVYEYGDAVSAVAAGEISSDEESTKAREKACEKFPGLC